MVSGDRRGRRALGLRLRGAAGSRAYLGLLSVDPAQHVAEFAGTPLRLTAIEFGILRAFLTRPTVVFSRDQIMNAAYQLNIQVSDRTIDSHIRNIRAKLSAVNCDNVIETVHGVGIDPNIVTASLKAVLSGMQRVMAGKPKG